MTHIYCVVIMYGIRILKIVRKIRQKFVIYKIKHQFNKLIAIISFNF